MDSLYLLLPLSVLLVLGLIVLFAWALHQGQFDDLEREGWRVLESTEPADPEAAAVQPSESLSKLDPAQFEPVRATPTMESQTVKPGAAHE